MAFNVLRIENAFEGTFNFVAWKDYMEVLLDENRLLEYIKYDIAKPQAYDALNLVQWNKYVAKEKRIILKGVRDHIVSNLHGKETLFAMWKV